MSRSRLSRFLFACIVVGLVFFGTAGVHHGEAIAHDSVLTMGHAQEDDSGRTSHLGVAQCCDATACVYLQVRVTTAFQPLPCIGTFGWLAQKAPSKNPEPALRPPRDDLQLLS